MADLKLAKPQIDVDVVTGEDISQDDIVGFVTSDGKLLVRGSFDIDPSLIGSHWVKPPKTSILERLYKRFWQWLVK